MAAIADILWPGMKVMEPASKLGGILADKPGYHNTRKRLLAQGRSFDYSIAQFAIDREGPDGEASAIDWTFPDAQAGKYATIAKYSKRLLQAGMAGDADPRTVYMREFYGNADLDLEVEGWDYSRKRAATSDKSHLWHIHISIHRKYANDRRAMEAILSILRGETATQWKVRMGRKVTMLPVAGHLPVVKEGDSDPVVDGGTRYITRAQKLLGVTADGDYGPATSAAVKKMMAEDATRTTGTGTTISVPEWRRLYGLWA